MSRPVSLHKRSLGTENGFTLLELLLALAFLSIILAALYSTFFLAHKAVGALDDSILKLREGRMIMDVMTRELESASYRSDRDYSVFRVEDRDIFGKQASKLTFDTFSPLTPGASRISYFVTERNETMVLYKTIEDPHKTDMKSEETEMIEDIGAFSVEVRDKGGWVRTWDASETRKMPEEIRITVTIKTKDREHTLYGIITPMIGGRI
jgi:prepilin-type N-terminal cleavage/methylation domain-containing protein